MSPTTANPVHATVTDTTRRPVSQPLPRVGEKQDLEHGDPDSVKDLASGTRRVQSDS